MKNLETIVTFNVLHDTVSTVIALILVQFLLANISMVLFVKLKKNAAGKKESAHGKKKAPETEADEKEVSISVLNIQVGLIRKAWKHPSADRYANIFLSFPPRVHYIH